MKRRRLTDLSLRTKITLVISLVSGLSLLLACAGFGMYEIVGYRRAMLQDLVLKADVVGANCRAELSFDDRAAALVSLKKLEEASGAIVWAAARGSVRPGPAMAAFPLVLLLLTLTVFGLALAVSALAVHFGDVRDIVGNLLTLAFFLTPVLYPASAVPERFRFLLRVNPFGTFFSGVHDSLFFVRPIPAKDWAWMAGTAVVCLVAGAAIFERLRDTLAEEA